MFDYVPISLTPWEKGWLSEERTPWFSFVGIICSSLVGNIYLFLIFLTISLLGLVVKVMSSCCCSWVFWHWVTIFFKVIWVARVVNLKLAFTEWFFYNLVILIKLCKIRYVNLTKLLYFRETRLVVWKIENFDELQLPQSLIFFAEILHLFPT